MKLKFILAIFLLAGCSNMKKIDQKPESGYKDVNGIRMYYEIRGEGSPLVLIHGAGSTIYTTYGRIIDDLAKTRRVIGVELQAHGHTSDRDAPLSFTQDADDVAELMRQLNVSDADVMGFSNGATAALYISLRHAGLVRRVVAASPLLKKDGTFPQFWDFMKAARLENMPDQLKTEYMKINGDSTKLQNMHDKCAERMVNFKEMTDEELKSINVPVLLVSGTADVGTPEHIVQMWRKIPGSTMAILPGVHGEFLGEITTPDLDRKEFEILTLLNRFLN